MLVAAIHKRQLHSDTPVLVEGVVETGDEVAIDGAHFVVFAWNLAYAYVLGAGTRLVLIDEFIAQIQTSARLDPGALDAPVGIQRAERTAATSLGIDCRNQQYRR